MNGWLPGALPAWLDDGAGLDHSGSTSPVGRAAIAGRLALTGEPAEKCRAMALSALADGGLGASATIDGRLALTWAVIALTYAR